LWLDVVMTHPYVSLGGAFPAVWRRLLAVVVGIVLMVAAPAAAQGPASVGDTGPAVGDFQGTDEACGFGNYTDDTYVAELGEDDMGVFVDLTQKSTGDTGRFRSDASGNISFKSAGDEEYVSIDIEGDSLVALYRYTSGDCTQEWIATVDLPPGFLEALVAGNAAPPEATTPPVEVSATDETATEPLRPEDAAIEETSTVQPGSEASEDTDGGSDLITLVLWGGISAVIAFLVWGGWYMLRPRRLYRADRGDPGVFVDDEEGITIKYDIDPHLFYDEPGDTGADRPGVIVDDDESVLEPPLPPGELVNDDCRPEREAFMMAQEAKNDALRAAENADEELARAKDELGRVEATTHNPLGESQPRIDVDPTASESELARQRRIHEMNVTEWQKLEDEASEARGQVEGAKARLNKARVDNDEAWQDFQRMRVWLESARVALDNCDGSAPPADDTEGGGESGGGAPGPGIVTEPPTPEPDPPEEEAGCTEKAEKDGQVVSSTDFRILGGPITVNVGTVAWERAGKTFTADAFADLDTSTVEELSAGIEQGRRSVRISVRIPTTIVTVKCLQVLVCESDRWIDSGRTKRVESRADGSPIDVLPTGAAGGLGMAKDRKLAGNMVSKAQVELEALRANQEAAENLECG